LSLSLVFVGKALFALWEDEPQDNPQDETTNETKWSIYIYMVGSDLEDAGLNQLSRFTETLIEEEAASEKENYDKMVSDRIREFAAEISDMGLTLPNVLYNKNLEIEKTEYVADQDDLGYATYSLNMIMNSDIPDGVQFIIQTGGAKRWLSPYVNPNRSQRFIIDKNGMTCIYDEPVVNMANPDTLEDFMVFCKENYPAENEVMLFWDHGNAYSGFGLDNIYGTDILSIREMASCFENVQKLYSTSEKLFDIIAFDACLMGNLETARLFKDYADYYLSSPEELSGLGWGYDRVIKAISENPEINPRQLGEAICKANVENVQIYVVDGLFPTTFSMIDLNKIEAVYDAYSSFAKTLLKDSIKDISNLTNVSEAADRTLAYAYGSSGGFNLLDLGSFAKNFQTYYPNESKAILDAVNECVLYTESTSYFKESTGISVFYPSKMIGHISLRKYLSYMYDLSDNMDINALYYYKVVGYLNESLREYVDQQGYGEVKVIDYEKLNNISYVAPELDGKYNFTYKLDPEYQALIQSVSLGLIFIDENTSNLAYFGEFDKKSVQEDGTVYSDFNLTMASLGGNELPSTQIGEDEEKITYRVPILYFGMNAYMIYTKDKQTGEYTIAGFNMSNDNGTGVAERTVMEFDEGDLFEIVYQYGNLNSTVKSYATAQYEYSKDMKIVDKTMSDGYYIEYLAFEDLRSDVHYSPMIVFKVENGVSTMQYIDWSIQAFDYGNKQ